MPPILNIKFVAVISLMLCIDSRAAFSKPPIANTGGSLLTAGICRIESERSYKLSLQIALGILGDQARRELDRSIASISRMRQELNGLNDKSAKTAKALTRANSALTDQVDSLPKLTAANASVMYDVNEDLLNKLNFLSFSLEAESSEGSSRLAALALRQASLAQRMAKIILLRSLDKSMVSKQGLQVDLNQSRIEFKNGLDLLTAEAESDKQLKARVEVARGQWLFYETALVSMTNSTNDLRNISTTSDRIAEQMIELVYLSNSMPIDKMNTARWQY
ncbi:hypothetical protein [Undibacterium oligocarboniphilum]|uniref:Uncharacterized protein n=1 Tax=Undibacterium oligocarboniphilum TaxID=666702 RepID=A0A850QL14_9BURK|nr:hypothetical protein [Undibacterium oligocarboniphilum]MBC3871714.1 hypothetical protein [Undibacterium oligocarboniphilum]NVO77410.1 hypothetical protein [Undibacterium oligocarboniphilum]